MNGSKCNKIRHVVRVKQIVRKWRKLASSRKAALGFLSCKVFARLRRFSFEAMKDSNPRPGVPGDVPAGHLAVYVGKHFTRFVIRTAYLNYPVFRTLLDEAEQEFGFNYGGGIAIPCDELLFEQILRLFSRNDLSIVKHLNLEELQSILYANKDWMRHCSTEAVLFEKDSTPLLSVN
ncbi:hypothetical protein SUGI_0462450 [Cryptomeria japonica]|uniref:protein SMALL AUXIN UP-REGULATED RNA 51 n=1 Tax=Cryptomeria japonica TaxID=3369 RepID=UPI002408AF11|nr:protein SMALL AUXIN UP-REGULATED RNA 51 [Cryptomeria japonica]GLJ24254.1 hypothetical protein SUGI_0462450 [Cryptomeria japonica]